MNAQGQIERSFGSETGIYRPDLRDVIEIRPITATRGGVWSAWINQYVLEQWDTAGHLIRAFRRDAEWFPAWWRPESSANQPPLPLIEAIQSQGDTLWVLIRIPDPKWEAAISLEPSRAPSREPRFRIDDPDGYHDTIIEIIDVQSGSVLASTRHEQALKGFAGSGLVFGQTTDAVGNPIVPIWRIQIVNPASERRKP